MRKKKPSYLYENYRFSRKVAILVPAQLLAPAQLPTCSNEMLQAPHGLFAPGQLLSNSLQSQTIGIVTCDTLHVYWTFQLVITVPGFPGVVYTCSKVWSNSVSPGGKGCMWRSSRCLEFPSRTAQGRHHGMEVAASQTGCIALCEWWHKVMQQTHNT